MNGAIMQRIIGLAVATFAFSTLNGVPAVANSATTGDANAFAQVRVNVRVFDQGRHRGAPIDVAALLTAARGAPPAICLLASQAVRGWGWGGGSDAPSTPLSSASVPTGSDDYESDAMPAADIQRLLAGLSSDDACVRELSVRLIGTQKAELVGGELVTRLGASDAGLRSVAALGLGLAGVESAVDPLIRTLRDASVDVRANSAWALGRIESGRALKPLTGLFGDEAEKVRLAAVSAVGRMDSTSVVPLL
ncbi:MAG TPA: HEAT repeat domain-containing protein, partial [Gemmatimonadaceae bacterium]|nr:HEAT repeat domain-containing protein [Gemmatimonadaceae bacterium]